MDLSFDLKIDFKEVVNTQPISSPIQQIPTTNTNKISVGIVSEDTQPYFNLFENGFKPDSRYIYLNGGPNDYGWAKNYSTDEWNSEIKGKRAINFIKNSQKYGITPIFVYYNICGQNESYYTNLQNIQNKTFMEAYFKDLKFFLDIINQYSPNDKVKIILEPDFLGYFMQNSGKNPKEIQAIVNVINSSGVVTDITFEDNLYGIVCAINYLISSTCKQVIFGWQINLWSNPVPLPIGTRGLMKCSDVLPIEDAKTFIKKTATETAAYYKSAGILEYGAHFFSIDKYGLDARLVTSDSSQNPWLFSYTNWNNYLFYVKTISDYLNKDAILWQMVVGHINRSSYTNKDLTNISPSGEDSSASFFLGDTFTPPSNDFNYWIDNKWNDTDLSYNGNTITWKSKLDKLKDYGIVEILFGAGVGASTNFWSDDGFCIGKLTEYIKK